MAFHVPEGHRYQIGPLATTQADGNNGAFVIHRLGRILWCIASDGDGWDHVSVHVQMATGQNRIPTWLEMAEVKRLFWDAEDWVVQYHPAASEYVNHHETTLHLWRPTGPGVVLPTPPAWMVG